MLDFETKMYFFDHYLDFFILYSYYKCSILSEEKF